MGIRKRIVFIVVCDVCGFEFDDAINFNDKEEAKKVVLEDGWIVDHGKFICSWCADDMS